jgi:hypothetical protein
MIPRSGDGLAAGGYAFFRLAIRAASAFAALIFPDRFFASDFTRPPSEPHLTNISRTDLGSLAMSEASTYGGYVQTVGLCLRDIRGLCMSRPSPKEI